MILWPAFTFLIGLALGSIITAMIRRKEPAEPIAEYEYNPERTKQ